MGRSAPPRAQTALRLHVPISAESLSDPDLATWLAQELESRSVHSGSLVLVLELAELGTEVRRFRAALEALQMIGVRLSVRGVNGAEAERQWVELPAFDLVVVAPPSTGAERNWRAERGACIARAVEHGKLVIAEGVADTVELGELMRLGVHYAESEALSSWSASPHSEL